MSKKKNQQKFNYKKNKEIKSNEVRLVGNEYNGIYSIEEALSVANNENLDLIEINNNANPPVCKIEDYNKFIYEKKKKLKEQNKKNKQNRQELKEIRFGPNTEEHDFNFKKKHTEKFIKDGNKVKTYVFFKGREMNFKDKGELLLLRLAKELQDIASVENTPKMEGNKMIMNLLPKK